MRLILASMGMMLVVAVAPADDKTEKIDATKLVGKWAPTGKEKDSAVVEFTKDGKFTITNTSDKKGEPITGTYTVNGNKITLSAKMMGMEQKIVVVVVKMTDDQIDTKHEGDDKIQTMTRIKGTDK